MTITTQRLAVREVAYKHYQDPEAKAWFHGWTDDMKAIIEMPGSGEVLIVPAHSIVFRDSPRWRNL